MSFDSLGSSGSCSSTSTTSSVATSESSQIVILVPNNQTFAPNITQGMSDMCTSGALHSNAITTTTYPGISHGSDSASQDQSLAKPQEDVHSLECSTAPPVTCEINQAPSEHENNLADGCLQGAVLTNALGLEKKETERENPSLTQLNYIPACEGNEQIIEMDSAHVVQIDGKQVMLEFNEPIVEVTNELSGVSAAGSQMHGYSTVHCVQSMNSHTASSEIHSGDYHNGDMIIPSKSAKEKVLHSLLDSQEGEYIEKQDNNVGEDNSCENVSEDSLESCIDDIWSEELLLKLISLHGAKEGWHDRNNHPALYEELRIELGLIGVMDWHSVENKWYQLYNIYSRLADRDDNISVKARKSALFNQLQEAEVSQLDFVPNEEKVQYAEYKPRAQTRHKRKSPEFIWSADITRRFIQMRADKHSEIPNKGHTAVYQEVLKELGIDDRVTVMMARKKWNYLVNRYQDECAAGGERSWSLMADMAVVMNTFAGLDVSKLKSRASPEFLWPNGLTVRFIELRMKKKDEFKKYGVQNTYTAILNELGVAHILTPTHLRKKWNYLVAKHKEITSSCVEGNHGWAFYDAMTAAIDSLSEEQQQQEKVAQSAVSHVSDHVWTRPVVLRFIQLRAAHSKEAKNSSSMYNSILAEMDLASVVKPHQARKKWNYLWNKFLELSEDGVSEYLRKAWPYYTVMSSVAHLIPDTGHTGLCETFKDENQNSQGGEGQKSGGRKQRSYSCFLCTSSSSGPSDYFTFENDQRLLHTQNTVMQVLEHLLGRKLVNFSTTTMLCSRCTLLVNDGDAVIHRHDKIKREVRELYQISLSRESTVPEEPCNIVMGNDLSSPAVEIEVNSVISVEEDGSGEMVATKQEKPNEESQYISYSKHGRKRKATVYTEAIQKCMKIEATDDNLPEFDTNLGDHYPDAKPKRRLINPRGRGRGRGRRGRGRGRGRGRPVMRSTLIGKGLDGLYSSSFRRESIPVQGPKIFHCSECKEEFKRYTDLVIHRKEKHTVIDNTPLEVEETILENGVITYFNKDKANSIGTSHPCKDCDKVFLRKDDLSYHHELHHTGGRGRAKSAFKDKSYVCEECGDTFLFKYKLKLHINNKHLNDAGEGANDFTCGDCGTKLGSLPGLTFHMRKHHDKVLNYKKTAEFLCNDCGFMAASGKKLKDHQEAHCGYAAKEQVQCEICGKTVLKVSLKMHKIKMHSEFKEQCDRCGEKYATKTDLLRHVNVVHLNILLYACKQCEEKFPTSDALRYHRVKMHEKPAFFCHICNKRYKRVGELNTHVKRVHNDRRKAEICSYCGKEYYDRSGLRNHLVSKHNVPPELTYSENYLRKKRVDGLPLAKIFESRVDLDEMRQNLSMGQDPHLQQQQQQPQQILAPDDPQGAGDHTLSRVAWVDETAAAARSLATYGEVNGHEEDSSMVVTEITENAEHQQIIIDPHGNIIHQGPHPTHHHHHHHHHDQHHNHHHQQTVMHNTTAPDGSLQVAHPHHHHHHNPHHHHQHHSAHHHDVAGETVHHGDINRLDVGYQMPHDHSAAAASAASHVPM